MKEWSGLTWQAVFFGQSDLPFLCRSKGFLQLRHCLHPVRYILIIGETTLVTKRFGELVRSRPFRNVEVLMALPVISRLWSAGLWRRVVLQALNRRFGRTYCLHSRHNPEDDSRHIGLYSPGFFCIFYIKRWSLIYLCVTWCLYFE